MVFFPILIVVFLFFQSFGNKPGEIKLFEKLNPRKSGITFSNKLTENEKENLLSFINFYTGSGVGILDVNNDGLMDIFFGGNQVSSRLYLNKGNLKFTDITKSAGVKTRRWITGVSIVDINQDGFDDIYLSVSGSLAFGNTENLLFIINRDNTFTEKGTIYNLNEKGQATHAAFFDYDGDGDLDVYILINPTDFELDNPGMLMKPMINGEAISTDKLYRNDGNGKFVDVSNKAGILIEGYGLGVNTSDFNHDGLVDVFVSNDYVTNDILYINNGDSTFTDELKSYFCYTSFASMGNDAGDINNDGLLDLIVLDMLPENSARQKVIVGTPDYTSFKNVLKLGYIPKFSRNMLYLNRGDGSFSEIGQLAGISKTGWSWGPVLSDLDNDGYKDLIVSTGFRRDLGHLDFVYNTDNSPFKISPHPVSDSLKLRAILNVKGFPITNYLYVNNGDLTFTKISQQWGLEEKTFSCGVAVADLDNDGDNDIIFNNVDQKAEIYENKANILLSNHYLKIRLQGPRGNRTGIGAKLSIYMKDKLQYTEFTPYRGYMSSMSREILFGCGNHTVVDSLAVIWPDGKRTLQYNIKTDTTITINYHGSLHIMNNAPNDAPLPVHFEEVSASLNINHRHVENAHDDFYKNPLLPIQHARLGPSVAVGDINGDGLEDFFVGGAQGSPGKLFFQNTDHTFDSHLFPFDYNYEDMGSLLFDFDGDNDLDLYVVSGGTFSRNSKMYQDRLYENTGAGRFLKTENVLPVINSSGSVVTAADFDGDNDLDLFIGGRVSPGRYPVIPRSYLLENSNGKFVDVTREKAPELALSGMVTAALWTDFNSDRAVDLIVLGEWMPIMFFENQNSRFVNKTGSTNIQNANGWWNSISAADYSSGEYRHYVLGNLGKNHAYTASGKYPLQLFAEDFDNNGQIDPVMAMKYNDGYYPIASRSIILTVFPQLKKVFNTYEKYAKTTIKGLLEYFESDGSMRLYASYFPTSLMTINDDGAIKLTELPVKGQFAPVYGSVASDLNNDGVMDFLLAGNFYPNNYLQGPLCASTGCIMISMPGHKRKLFQGHEVGFNIKTDSRALASLLFGNDEKIFIVSNNDDSLRVFKQTGRKYKTVKLDPLEYRGVIEMKTGEQQKVEFYYGSGYLSQSSRYLELPEDWIRAILFTYSGEKREIVRNK